MLNKVALKAGIVQLHTDMSEREENSIEEYAERLSNLLEAFVQSGSVAAGIPVSTSGSATSQLGSTTAAASII